MVLTPITFTEKQLLDGGLMSGLAARDPLQRCTEFNSKASVASRDQWALPNPHPQTACKALQSSL